MTKLIATYLMGNCEDFVDMTLESVKDVFDTIIIVYDTSSHDCTRDRISAWEDTLPDKIIVLERNYEHDSRVKNANSNARNHYLDYLKKYHLGDYCLVLDADEVPDENVQRLQEFIGTLDPDGRYLFSPRMIHLMGDLSHDDGTKEKHHVLNRFFRVHEELYYPEGEHPVLNSKHPGVTYGGIDFFTIYHLGYARPMFYIRERYLNHRAKSEIHTKDYLEDWYALHVTGNYPRRPIDIRQLPQSVKDYFLIGDYFYFRDRVLELKHFLMVKQWHDLLQPGTVLDLGCGRGPYMAAWNFLGVNAWGVELSAWAREHPLFGVAKERILLGDICEFQHAANAWDLVTLIDVLEHIPEEFFDKAVTNAIHAAKKYVLVSAPFEGDPNLYNDPTHLIFKPRAWWVEQFTKHGCKELPVPDNWLYRQQLLLFEVPGE